MHGVQEDPLHPIAVEQQRNCVVASKSTRFKHMLDVLAPEEVGRLQTDEQVVVKEQVCALNVRVPAAVCVLAPLQPFGSYRNARGRMRIRCVLV